MEFAQEGGPAQDVQSQNNQRLSNLENGLSIMESTSNLFSYWDIVSWLHPNANYRIVNDINEQPRAGGVGIYVAEGVVNIVVHYRDLYLHDQSEQLSKVVIGRTIRIGDNLAVVNSSEMPSLPDSYAGLNEDYIRFITEPLTDPEGFEELSKRVGDLVSIRVYQHNFKEVQDLLYLLIKSIVV